jgi:hypothetical protein
LNKNSWALNSAVECHLHTVEVIGSNPIAPTNVFWGLRAIRKTGQPTIQPTISLD